MAAPIAECFALVSRLMVILPVMALRVVAQGGWQDMMPDIDWIAAIVAGVAGFFAGALWYSPLMFRDAWREETRMAEGEENAVSPAVRLTAGAALSIISALVLAMVIGPEPTMRFAVAAGLGIALAWIVPAFGVQYLFEGRSLRLLAINGGYHCAQFAIMGLVIGLWP